MIDPSVVLESTKLPTLPSAALQLLELSRSPDATIAQFCRAIRTDPAISAKIVKAANSSYFGLASKVTSVETAIPLLGSTVVTSLALSFSLVMEADPNQHVNDYFQAFWSQSLLQAVTAEALAKRFALGDSSGCFLSGLLCDIGVLAQLNSIPLEYVRVLEETHSSGRALLDVERDRLGFDHIEIGAQLMMKWGMPALLLESLRLHHASFEEIERLHGNNARGRQLRALRFATYLGELLTPGHSRHVQEQLREFARSFLQLPEAELDSLLDEMRDRTEEAARFMSINTAKLARPSEILALANSQLVEIALREHVAKSDVAVKTAALEIENRRLKQRNTELNEQAGVDSLTGLNNRRAFDHCLEEVIEDCLLAHQSLSVIFADLDHFKHVNDSYGHPFGDEVLRRVAKIVKSQVRDSDFAARYGGEEFVVVTPRCPESMVSAIADRIRIQVEAEQFQFSHATIRVTVSVGACVVPYCTLCRLLKHEIAEYVLQEADNAMYDCKRNGRNRTLFKVCNPVDSIVEG